MTPEKLKIGLIVDDLCVGMWFYHALERIVNSDHARISLVILAENIHFRGKSLDKNGQKSIYEFFNQIDERLFLGQANAFQSINLQQIITGVPIITIKPMGGENSKVVSVEDYEKIRKYDLDILLTNGFEGFHESIVTTAKLGVWFFDHSDRRVKSPRFSGFWETVNSSPVTTAKLMMAHGNPFTERIVYSSQFLTYIFSPARNRNILFWASSSFLPRQIEHLYQLGETKFISVTARFNRDMDTKNLIQYGVPSSFDTLRSYGKLFVRQMNEVFHRIFFLDAWFLMFSLGDNELFSVGDFTLLTPPKDRFWADPQVIQKNGKNFIFVEEFIYKNKKGHLSVIEMDSRGQTKAPVPILIENHHLSYPFVFEYESRTYMVPESADHNTIDLYECDEFPDKWKYKMTLMKNIKAVDTTLFYDQGLWWLFTGIAENEGAFPEVELFLFYSNNLFTTKWVSHPLNPVISDVSTARPAGPLFFMDGKIYRPSQNCSKKYGYGFNLNEIQRLTPTEYLEKKVVEVVPDWNKRVTGTHTYTRVDRLLVIDAYTRRGKFR